MAIVIEGIIGGDVSGTFEGTRTFTEQWRYFSDTNTRPIHVHDFIPVAYGESHPDYFQAYCVDKRAKSVETVTLNGARMIAWDVDITWGPLEPRFRDGEVNPLLLPPVWTWTPENFDKIVYEDYEGTPLVNSAGDYFDPPILLPQVRGVLTARVNMPLSGVTIPDLAALSNKVNSDAIGYWAPKTLMSGALVQPAPSYNQFYNISFYEMEFNFLFNPDTWEEEIYDMGYRYLDSSGKPVKILDKSGQEIQQPAFLDGDGGKLEYPITEVYTLPFKLVEEISFASSFGEFLGTDWQNV